MENKHKCSQMHGLGEDQRMHEWENGERRRRQPSVQLVDG